MTARGLAIGLAGLALSAGESRQSAMDTSDRRPSREIPAECTSTSNR